MSDHGLTEADLGLLDLLAYLNLRHGRTAKALVYFRQLRQAEPETPRYWRGLALAALREGQIEESEQAIIEARRLGIDANDVRPALLLHAEIAHHRGDTALRDELLETFAHFHHEQPHE